MKEKIRTQGKRSDIPKELSAQTILTKLKREDAYMNFFCSQSFKIQTSLSFLTSYPIFASAPNKTPESTALQSISLCDHFVHICYPLILF